MQGFSRNMSRAGCSGASLALNRAAHFRHGSFSSRAICSPLRATKEPGQGPEAESERPATGKSAGPSGQAGQEERVSEAWSNFQQAQGDLDAALDKLEAEITAQSIAETKESLRQLFISAGLDPARVETMDIPDMSRAEDVGKLWKEVVNLFADATLEASGFPVTDSGRVFIADLINNVLGATAALCLISPPIIFYGASAAGDSNAALYAWGVLIAVTTRPALPFAPPTFGWAMDVLTGGQFSATEPESNKMEVDAANNRNLVPTLNTALTIGSLLFIFPQLFGWTTYEEAKTLVLSLACGWLLSDVLLAFGTIIGYQWTVDDHGDFYG